VKRPFEHDGGTATARDNQAKRAKKFDVDFSVVPGPPKTASAADAWRSSASGSTAKQRAPMKAMNPYLAHVYEAKSKDVPEFKKKKSSKGRGTIDASSSGIDKDRGDNAGVTGNDDGYDPVLAQTSRPKERKKRDIQFVEPGKWQQIAERKREIAAKAEASGYVSGRKAGHTITSSTMASVYGGAGGSVSLGAPAEDDTAHPRADASPDTEGMPLVMEWWDVALLPSKLKKEVAAMEDRLISRQAKAAMKYLDGTPSTVAHEINSMKESNDLEDLRMRCYVEASLVHCKTSSLVQHIVPIQPPRVAPEKQPVLHMTKKELKRQRKLRRQARQRELQDMQAAGLIPAPEPRLTLKNFIQVMGDQAYVDPSKIEQKVQEQMEARQRAHMERNEAMKLTKEQRSAKRARKYHEDTSTGVTVAVFYVLDTSHPFIRAKMDLNAQQNNITGGVLECEVPRLSCVICEGGPKAIKRYRRLMEVRMKWTGPSVGNSNLMIDDAPGDDEGSAHKFNPDNKCELVWQGMAVKRYFKGFVFQACETADQARAVLKSKGVAHYWDQVLEHHRSGGSSNALQLRLAADSASESDPGESDVEDVAMKDSDT
jgi:U4/U6 small nuclear ribonucleoprotein PRP3